MKTARRHELQTNELADKLARGIVAAKPYARLFLGGLIALALVLVAMVWWSQNRQQNAGMSWQKFFEATNLSASSGAGDSEKLDEIATKYPGSAAAGFAAVVGGESLLQSGVERLLNDKAEGRAELRKAVDQFHAASAAVKDPLIRQQAIYGLARAYESLGELDKAKEQYQVAIDSLSDGPFNGAASRRLTALKSDMTARFYDWLAGYEPPKPFLDAPGKPGQKPSDKFLDAPGSLLPFGSREKSDSSGFDENSPDLLKPFKSPEKPVADGVKPDSDKPTESPKPAGENPPEKSGNNEPGEKKPDAAKPDEPKPAEPTGAGPKLDDPKSGGSTPGKK